MKSWKTTVGGLLAALGAPLAASSDETTKQIGVVLAALGAIILGLSARDNTVTSEESGAKDAEVARIYKQMDAGK